MILKDITAAITFVLHISISSLFYELHQSKQKRSDYNTSATIYNQNSHGMGIKNARIGRLSKKERINPIAVIYLNRLSDLLFVLARYTNNKGKKDILWKPGKNLKKK